jgi:PKD repeat protein
MLKLFRTPLALAAFGVAFGLALIPVHAARAAAPVINSIGNLTVSEGVALVFTVTASDADGDALTLFPPVLPPGASFNAATGSFVWTPTYSQSGTYPSLTFGVSDGTTYVSETITITVPDANQAPFASTGGPYTGTAGSPLRFASTGSTDADGATLTSVWQFGDSLSGAGPITLHAFASAGTYTVTLTVSDGATTATATTTATIATALPGGNGSPAAHGPAVRLRLTPAETTVDADTDVGFSAVASDTVGTEWDVTTTSTFSTDDPRGSFDGTVFRPGAIGTWTIQADYGGLLATATVTVTPGAVARIVVNPSSDPEEVPAGSRRVFTADGFDADSNPVAPLPVDWTVGGGVGTITSQGTFTASGEGNGAVLARYGGVVGSSRVTVLPKAAAIAETPPPTKRISAASTGTAGEVLGTQTEEPPAPETTTEAPDSNAACTNALHWWGWLLILLGYYLVVVGVMYATRRVAGYVFWILPLALTAAVLWTFFRYRCDTFYPWFPWLTIIGGLIIALFRPLPPEPPPASPAPPQPTML